MFNFHCVVSVIKPSYSSRGPVADLGGLLLSQATLVCALEYSLLMTKVLFFLLFPFYRGDTSHLSLTVFYAESRHAVLRTGDCALGRALVS